MTDAQDPGPITAELSAAGDVASDVALQPIDVLLILGIGALVLLLFASLLRALAALALIMDRRQSDARVVRRFRRFGLFERIEYEFFSSQGSHRGTAPAWCEEDGSLLIAWRPAHPDTHRPVRLLGHDLFNGLSFMGYGLVLALLHAGVSLLQQWDRRR